MDPTPGREYDFGGLAELSRRGRSLVVRLCEPHDVLSSSLVAGGTRDDTGWLVNHQVCEPDQELRIEDLPGGSLEAYHRHVCTKLGIDADRTALMLTAASMDNAAVVAEHFRDLSVWSVVTAGVEHNATRAGDSALWYEWDGTWQYVEGTINTMVLVNRCLGAGALVRATVTATEAKTAALQELCVGSRYSDGWATGTGTDQMAVAACRRGEPALSSAGQHAKLGELIARSVKEAVTQALAWQNDLTPAGQGSVWRMMARFVRSRDALGSAIEEHLESPPPGAGMRVLGAVDREACVGACVAAMTAIWERIGWGVLDADPARAALRDQAVLLATHVAGRHDCHAALARELASPPPEARDLVGLVCRAIAVGYRHRSG